MGATVEVGLPVARFKILNERYFGFFSFWTWKLDPFSAHERDLAVPTFNVSFARHPVFPVDDAPLTPIKDSGFFSELIQYLDTQKYLFTLINSAKKTILLQYVFDADSREIVLTEDSTGTNGLAAFEYLSRMLPGVFLEQKTLILHGTLFEFEGRGIIVSAPAETGKTTHAHLWRDHKGAIILNGDLSACYKKRVDGQSVWTGFGMPWCGESGEYMNREVPITAVVALERGEKNEVCRLSGAEAFGAVVPQLKLPVWDKALSEAGVDLLIEMLDKIPVFRLRCRPDAESVEVLERALREL